VNEAETIKRATQGDEAAWVALMQAHQQAVLRLAYLLLRDADEAEDVAQETFIRAFRALHTFDRERPLRPWLLQIATNLSRNRQRSVRRYLGMLSRMVRSEPEPVTFNGERSGQQWEAHQLWQAIGRLRSTDREILYLRYFLDLAESEMTSILNVAPGTVKSRLHRATGRLRAVVDGEFPSLREERQP
jgi:RNA polymerase sigma-70 factor (ECF subfamily)